ncbi:GTP:AMP phosphotransferase AK3, mitochondrial [Orussus abietinus]|uniref:GTP:AMP phosphotransferase AK3, mitochondrial n=1 Tax=Orussus abietinus TaxID=222816 RepID=UPI000626E55B|nr:GTP:AMP phosphotransferase AK3, mitochondrial [Orussus abietinus]
MASTSTISTITTSLWFVVITALVATHQYGRVRGACDIVERYAASCDSRPLSAPSCQSPIKKMVAVSTCRAKVAAFRAVILGAPASGKGTVSSRIVDNFGVVHISSGDKLRLHAANNTELGKEVKKHLNEGTFVPDDTMISLIGKEIESLGERNWLLDGFPRTLSQAEKLQKLHPVSLVLNLVVPHSAILERIQSRWVHLPSGRVYNIGFNDPKVPGKDDVTGEPLSQRADDKPEIVKKRLKDYASKTEPVIRFYRDLGVLQDFESSTTDEMWPKIKECVAKFVHK